MKKSVIIFIFLLLFFPLISAVNFEMNTEFDRGETLIAKISGNFLDQITRTNVYFYRNHVRIPLVYDVSKFDDDFYIYAMLTGKSQGNYSVIIKDVRYMGGIEISEEHLVKNFSITENLADFSIDPGFIVAYDDFSIEAQNLQNDEITIQIKVDNDTIETTLKSGEKKDLNFGTQGISAPETRRVELSTNNTNYFVPVFVEKKETIPEEVESEFGFESSTLEVQMSTSSDTRRVLYIHNTGEADLEDVILYTSPILESFVILSDEIIDIEKNSTERIELYIVSDVTEKIVEGELIAETPEGLLISMTIVLDFIEDFIPLDGSADEPVSILSCEEEGGKICESDEECSGDFIYATDDVCCMAECEGPEEGTSRGKIIGWLIIIFIIILVFWFFKSKYLGVGKRINLFSRRR
jgi:hypothetical protein